MNSHNKPPGFGRAQPATAQLKTVAKPAASAQSVNRPVAPPVYRPQSAPNVLLRKTPIAPPVYRPQQTPKVLQKKSALTQNPQPGQTRSQTPLAPPVYRPDAKKILQPKAISPLQNRPDQKRIAQPGAKMPPVYPAKSPQFAAIQRTALQRGNIQRFPVIQRAAKRKRDELEYKLDYVMVPDEDMESYTRHVMMRTRHFFAVLLNAIFEMQDQVGDVEPGMFSDHAAAQEAKGFRLGPEPVAKIDAAHLMNVTLVPGKFPKKTPQVELLYIASGATTMEYQKANIGPDKLIDSQQTKTKNEILLAAQATPVNKAFLLAHVTKHLTALVLALTIADAGDGSLLSKARAAALAAVVADLKNIESVIREIEAELVKKLA